ncbi:MAG: acetyl-CoA carboxylase biotin carboxyl carrier protein subunit [Novosphingobium meiothermophilum]
MKTGDTIAVLESMKMECPVLSPGTGRIVALYVTEKQSLQPGAPIFALEKAA